MNNKIIEEGLEWYSQKREAPASNDKKLDIYQQFDMEVLQSLRPWYSNAFMALKTLEELLENDKQREKDGYPRRIRIGRIVKPSRGKKDQIVVVPTTTEPKFMHDDSITEEEETGGSGEGQEGEVIGEQQAEPQEGEGEGQGAGQGQGSEHDVVSNAYDLGRILTEKFQLPNLKIKGKKRSLTKYKYDLTDRHRATGQLLDKKETLRNVIKTNIMLGRLSAEDVPDTEDLLINPKDRTYRVFSKEKDFETQAVVFFVRDYSGSMMGKPTEVITTQHLFIYSWLMFQYQNNVATRFILHDTEVKEVADFYTYHNSQVAGGTQIYPAYELVNDIVMKENLAVDNNIYVFHGTDGDDWDGGEKQAIEALKKMLTYSNRVGITVARNSWSGNKTTVVENYINNSNLLKEKANLLKMDALSAESATESRIIESIRKLIG